MLAALADRLTKALALARQGSGPLIPGVMNFRLMENRGVAFSMLSGRGLLPILLTAAILIGVTGYLAARPRAPKGFRAGLWLIVGGGAGNLYDRLTTGGVTDFLEPAFVRFAVFNVADISICLGAALAVIGVVMAERKRGA